MNSKLAYTLAVLLLFTVSPVCAHAQQDTIRISLEEAIYESSVNSVDAMVARNEFQTSYWTFKTYRAELLPEVVLDGTLPYYSKSYNQFQNTDGTYTFVGNDYSRFDAGISISQNIPWTGAKLSVESNLQRLNQYGDNPKRQYMLMPVAVTLEQPILGFNRVKWMQKIEPVKYKEAQARLVSQLENVTITAISYYFNLLLGEMNFGIATQNYKNTEHLYAIAEAKRKIGQISENELLQLKLSCLKAEAYVTEARSLLKASMFQLRSFLGYKEEVVLVPVIPDLLAKLYLNYDEVLRLALENSPFTQEIQRRQLEAMRNVSQAKSERWNASLFLSFGLSGQDDHMPQIFDNLRGNQVVNMGLRIPLLDWGRGKGRVKVAESNHEVVQSRIEKEEIDFKQQIFLQVENFNNQSMQVSIAEETDRVAQRRYETSMEAFILGKIDLLNFNDAQTSKDEAKRKYIEEMYRLWSYYYQIRSITLYDFINNTDLFAKMMRDYE